MARKKKNIDDGLQYYQIITMNGLEDVKPPKPEKERYIYQYSGSVKQFDRIVIEHFEATTTAVSAKQALNNIAFRAKRKLGLAPNAKIELTAKIQVIDK
jgi:hypothetical protein